MNATPRCMRVLILSLLASVAWNTSAQTGLTGWSTPETVWINPERIGNAPGVVLIEGVPTVALYQRRQLPDRTLGPTALLISQRVPGPTRASWTPPDTLGTLAPLDYPSIASDGTTLFATWGDGPGTLEEGLDRIVVASRSDPTGDELETVVRRPLDGPWPHVWPSFPQVCATAGTPSVLYSEVTDRGLYLTFSRRRPDGSWGEPIPVAEGYSGSLSQDSHGDPLIAFLSANSRTGEQAVALAWSRDSGQTWETRTVAPRPQGERQASPHAARDASGRLHVVWRRSTDNTQRFGEFQYAYSDDDGYTWTESESVRPSRPWEFSNISLLLDATGHPHVFSFQQPGFLSPEGEIVHTARRDDGTWTPQRTLFGATIVRWAPQVPSLLLADGQLHAAWSEVRAGQTITQYASAPESWLADQVAQPAETPSVSLLRAFPNPASDSVTFIYAPPESGPVMLRVVAANGRLVAERTLGSRPAGPQRVTLPTTNFASGHYTVTFTTGTAAEQRASFIVAH